MLRDKHGLVIGGMEDVKYTEYELMFKPGTKLFIYTDGITEATNVEDEMFGMERLLEALNAEFAVFSYQSSDEDVATAHDIYMAQVRLLRAQQALAKKLKKKAQTVKRAKAVTVKGPCGKVRYALAGVSKAKFKKYFKVNAKAGKITVKKGKYTVKIKVSASGNGNYLPAAKTVKVTMKVR